MIVSLSEYKKKLQGCWLGKNIGGVLGAPFESKRQINHADFYIQDLNGDPPPNDDLDLQLVWLNAVEKHGRATDAAILGEYWLSYVLPEWVEYGSGKSNLRNGIFPPLSGYIDNQYKDSCGCFIRSEIWACIAPGRPDTAVRYAYEDAIVDHADEGLYGEMFCAAVESAAFVTCDTDKLISIGLSYIPESCGVANAVKTAVNAYKSGITWEEARTAVMTAEPGAFGLQNLPVSDFPDDVPAGKPGYDAPSNIGLMIIGWLYGEGDFGKSICLANNCGEDTDCTAATLGAILGICGGIDSIPEKWAAPIGRIINTCCINTTNLGITIPSTVDELTERILRLTPMFLGSEYCDILAENGYTITMPDTEELYCPENNRYLKHIYVAQKPEEPHIYELIRSPYTVRRRFPFFDAELDYIDGPYFTADTPKNLRLTVRDNQNNHSHQWVTVRWYTNNGASVYPPEISMPMQSTYKHNCNFDFKVTISSPAAAKTELIADISFAGRHTGGTVKAVLFAGASKQ